MIRGLTYYIGYLLFSWISLLESLINIIVYPFGLHLVKNSSGESLFVADFSFKFWVWYSNKFLKRFFISGLANDQRIVNLTNKAYD